MSERSVRIAIGLAAVLLVTVTLAGAVAASAAVTHEIADGDRCETGGGDLDDAPQTVTPENVTSLAGNVTNCLAGDATGSQPPTSGR